MNVWAALLSAFVIPAALADDGPLADPAPPPALSALGAAAVKPSPLSGIYEVHFGPNVVYMSDDGRYVFQGDLIDREAGVNLTDEGRRNALRATLSSLDESSMIIFPAATESVGQVTVFTDVDCGFCRRLHDEVPALNDMGVTVRYVAFPRAGLSGRTYEKMISVWCAADQLTAMTDAKAGKNIADAQCASPVSEHYALGQRIGVRGTPAIMLDDGTMLPGYVPAAELVNLVREHAVQ